MSKNILTIDDEQGIRDVFTMAFEDDDEVNVFTAASGQEGLEHIKDQDISLVFLDLRMPGMNGVDTLKAIRKDHPDLKVYILTAFYYEFMTELEACTKAGIDFELMHKPIQLQQLRAVVKSVLESGVATIS